MLVLQDMLAHHMIDNGKIEVGKRVTDFRIHAFRLHSMFRLSVCVSRFSREEHPAVAEALSPRPYNGRLAAVAEERLYFHLIVSVARFQDARRCSCSSSRKRCSHSRKRPRCSHSYCCQSEEPHALWGHLPFERKGKYFFKIRAAYAAKKRGSSLLGLSLCAFSLFRVNVSP